jgi:1-aminocyclopropane-1-carboxylate deaminase
MIFGIMDGIIKNQYPPNTKIIAIHTGGLQGIKGVNEKRRRKKKTLINTNV